MPMMIDDVIDDRDLEGGNTGEDNGGDGDDDQGGQNERVTMAGAMMMTITGSDRS